jgi:flavodoxin I
MDRDEDSSEGNRHGRHRPFYGSTTGNTKDAATRIKTAFGRDVVTVASIAGATADDLNQFDVLILGTSTWGFGDWQDDWAAFQRELAQVNWSGKRVALFGLAISTVTPTRSSTQWDAP